MIMTAFKTAFTELLKLRTPVVVAPMAGATNGNLAAKVSNAGGFGFIHTNYADVAAFRKDLEVVRSALTPTADRAGADAIGSATTGSSAPSHSHSRDAPAPTSAAVLPIGVGYLGWKLDEPNPRNAPELLLSIALEARVAAVWLSFGNDLGRWVRFVRDYDGKREVVHRTLLFVQVNSVEEARRAAEEWRVDVLVAQGIEAGGHGHSRAPPILTLIPAIRAALPKHPPLLAAGGIATGAQLAAVLALGAHGAVVGTRFLLTPETSWSPAQKALLLNADGSQTVRGEAFDIARGTMGWPEGVDGRALRNAMVDDVQKISDHAEVRKKYAELAGRGDVNGLVTWSGTSVGLVNDVKHAGDIVKELHEDAIAHISAASLSLTTVTV